MCVVSYFKVYPQLFDSLPHAGSVSHLYSPRTPKLARGEASKFLGDGSTSPPLASHSGRRSSSPLAPPPAKQVPGGFSRLTATCMQPGKSTSLVMVVQGAAVGSVFARRHCRTEPASSHSERRSSSPLAPPPVKQVPSDFSMLTATCMQRGESRAAVMVLQETAVGPVIASRRCRTEPASSHSERRSSSPLAPPPILNITLSRTA